MGREVASRLDWRFVDNDDRIVEESGRPIEAIFREDGEPRFREFERRALAAVCAGDRQVVATGGGTAEDERNRRLMGDNGAVVCLEARPETLLTRLGEQASGLGGSEVRPMLSGPDSLGRIVELKSRRQASYALADWTVHTDRLTPSQAADEVIRAWAVRSRRPGSGSRDGSEDLAATVQTSQGDYPVWVGWGTLPGLGERVRSMMSPGAAYVISDERVYRHARRAQVSLEAAGVPSHLFLVPPGEANKSLETAGHIYTWLAGRRAERGHLVVAVGGGVVGDLAGFVAATYLRGVAFGQVPTTLLAMMDAAVGGKTGVDLPQGKNLVGAFYQPRFVLGDPQTLETLPGRELASGWAEAIKHGLILDEALLQMMEDERKALLSLDQRACTEVIRRSVAVKAGVVSRDEGETLGFRVLLNYGHTLGHAIEAASGYTRYLHGEAVSVGMMGAAWISHRLGLLLDSGLERQRAVLEAYGLPPPLRGRRHGRYRGGDGHGQEDGRWVHPVGAAGGDRAGDYPGWCGAGARPRGAACPAGLAPSLRLGLSVTCVSVLRYLLRTPRACFHD